MIVAKIILLFPPLLLLANAQGGGRFGFFSRPDFRRPRPWDRPTMAPVPDTPMPTEKVAEHVTDSPRARTELPTIAAERSSSAAPVISVPRFVPRGRVWARPVFGPRPTEISTPAATASTELITIKPDYNSPVVSVVSSTTEPEGYTSTPSTRVPFVDNHAQYKDPNNFNSRGRYSPKLTNNNEQIPSDSMKTTTTTTSTRVPFVDNHAQYKDPNNFDSRGRYSPKLTNNNEQIPSDSMKTTTTTTSTRVPFVDNHAQYKDPNNFDSRGRYSPKLTNNNEQIPSDSMKTTTTTTSTRVPFVDNHAQYKDPNNFDSRGRYSPKLTNNNEQIPSDSMKTTTTTTSTRVPLVDNHAQYKDPNNFDSRGRYSPKLTNNNEQIPSDSMKTTTTTTSTRVPLVDNHAQYKDPNNFDSRGRYSPKLTNNNEQIPSDSMKTTTTTTSTRVPLVDNHAQYKDPNNFDSRGRYSPKLTNNNEQIPSDSMKTTTTTTSTRVPFVDNHAQYKDPNNFDSRGRYSPKLTNNNEQIPSDSMKTTTTTTSTRVPLVDNHAQYKDPNNFDSRGRYSPKLTNNNEQIPSDSMKTTTTKIPSTTEKITQRVTEQTTTTTEKQSPMTSSTSTTTTEVPFINNHIKYNESLSNNLETGFPTQAPLHLDAPITEIKSTPAPSTTPRINFIPTRAPNFDSRSRFPPYMSHNIPTIRPLSVPGDYSKSTSTTIAPKTGLPSSTTESVRFTVDPSTHVPFVDEFNKYNSVYLTKKTPIPFKIISTTETAPATTYHYNSMYQISYNDEYNITNDSQLPSTTTPKVITMGTKEPEEYIVTATPILALQEEYDNGFTSQPPVEYTNGYEKTSNIPSTFYDDNAQIYPVYRPDNGKVSHYEGSSPSTREPERYTVATTTKIPFIDFQKINDDGFTSAPPVEYTNGHAKITEILPSTNGFDEFIQNIYQNNNHKENYEHSWTPKTVPTTVPTTQSYQFTRPTTTTDQAPVTQPVRYTNNYRYNDITTKPATRYTTTTTAKPSTVAKNKVYDLNNFKCKNEDSYYSISNQCDDFIECKSGYPIQNTCPDGLHFNPAAKYPEFPCAYPSEVKCESNSALRKADPTSECPRRYGYFSMQDGSCDKYIMCQEGLATVMSCPAGLAFSVATSSCDWPSNVPDCIPGVFKGFTCPPPELNEDGQPIHSIYKYGYNKSCKKYIACQRGHPRLLSCDAGLAFDTVSESCVDEYEVTDCT